MAQAPVAEPAWKRALKAPLTWEIPFVAALAGWMFWIRMLPYKALVGSGRAFYIGTDPFYHFRETLGIVRAFPRVPRWDPWTFYPNGTGTGQFGSLFDWLCAAIVVVTQGKNASEHYVATVLGWFPALLGALMIVPFYFLAKRLVGRPGAVVAAVTLALLPGEFLIRSIAGYSDHHVAEDLFSIVALLGVLVAAERAHEKRAALEARDWTRAWPALAWAVVGGVALAANFYAWPPAILFLGILTIWMTVVIVLENGRGEDPLGHLIGMCIAFVVAGLLMLPSVETTFLGEYNTYGILQPALCFASAAWLLAVHFASAWARKRGLSPWIVPAAIVALALVAFFTVEFALSTIYSSLSWGLSWITGINAPRTTLTIAEARPAAFFCQGSTQDYTCLSDDFGFVAPLGVFLLAGVVIWAIWKRRRSDILLALWSLVIFNATTTQIRFSYYLAVNLALLVGWAAARVAEMTGLTRSPEAERDAALAAKKTKGRKAQARAAGATSRPVQLFAVAAVLLLVVPGNVVPSQRARPAWIDANIQAPDGDLVLWMRGLDWMRNNTPDAGVNLGLVVPKPPAGQLYEYPANTYGVLSWWDYGHWIETQALRPPVANPFQQAAPFASLWFTERNPDVADKMLDDWVQGKGPVRYVFIDDAMATGKFGAITVWAHNNNESRPVFGQEYATQKTFVDEQGASHRLLDTSPVYEESMMGRLYDADGEGLARYRLVWEDAQYVPIGNVVDQSDQLRNGCFHTVLYSCVGPINFNDVASTPPGRIHAFAADAKGYHMILASRLKLFERVPGAHLVGTAAPGATVHATVSLVVQQPDGGTRPFGHSVTTTAGPDGAFDLVFPYSTSGARGPEQGGTTSLVKPMSQVSVDAGGRHATVDVPDDAVLQGKSIDVVLG